MRFRPFFLLAASAAVTALVASDAGAFLIASSGPVNGVAASPPGFSNCTACHAGTANSGAGSMAISGVPATYLPGQTYTVTVTVDDPSASRWGFEMTAIDDFGAQGGSFSAAGQNTLQVSSSGGFQYIKHTTAGTFPGTAGPRSWTFEWTAPVTGREAVNFYAAGNAANNNSNITGDEIYTASTASAESGSGINVTMNPQPDTILPRRSTNWTIPVRVRNHTSSPVTNLVVVSRVKLPNGSFFPGSGFLTSPVSLSLPAEGQDEFTFTHAIPAGAPLITATYELFVGVPPSTLVGMEKFVFTVQP
ncbi:MAG TPA: choice-of-anchor V domain-containing protein [Planctomycetota bacterium]